MLKALKDLVISGRQKSDPAGTSMTRVELAAAVLMIEIAIADSSFDQAERDSIRDILVNRFDQPVDEANGLISLATQEVDDAVSLYEFTSLLNQELDNLEKLEVIELLWQVAYADDVLDKYEEYNLRKIADLLHIPHREFMKAKHRAIDGQAG